MFKQIFATYFLAILLFACSTPKQNISIQFKDYRIQQSDKKDSTLTAMLKPYSDNIHQSMNTVIGFSTKGLSKKQPESELGNFLADCMKIMAEEKFSQKVDAAFLNYGGIRSYLPKGDITTGNIYELMPFDNLVVLQQVSGKTLNQFLNKIAERGGWPVSGVKMQIKDKQAVNIFINNKPLEENATYTIANNDYVARGGDDCDMLKEIPVNNKGYLFRDAIIAFIKQLTKQGKPIEWKIENRITY
ncbi:MAG: 5'-nucleotidase C-terminal domain-containing protein [Chitinophagaceae bacterium]|nr:5'-nucleotidase C-terminal domain-containing protein [Chitinophagaceae bacterium]